MSFLKFVLLLSTSTIISFSLVFAGVRDELPIEIPYDKTADTDVQMVVHAGQSWGKIEIRHGFLHGLQNSDTLSDSMTAYLKPRNWRLYKSESYAEAVLHNVRITYGLSDHYAWAQGGFPQADPWADWEEFEEYILMVLQYYDDAFPDNPPAFYDIWNEPDHSYFWSGTFNQLVETFSRAVNVVKTFNPDAKVVGPSISWYRPEGYGEENIIDLLIALDTLYDIRLDAISWHENGGFPDYGPGRPEDMYWDYLSITDAISQHFPEDYQPEYHINEFAGGRVHLSPGWTLGYLFWVNYLKIDLAARACWGIYNNDPPNYEYYSDCWAGLNGVFMRDGYTPQPIYWVHRAYAEMEGFEFLPIGTSNAHFLMLAGKNDSLGALRLLTGMYADTITGGVEILIDEYRYSDNWVRVDVYNLPNFEQFYSDPPVSMPWPQGPVLLSSEVMSVDGNQISIFLDSFEEGEVNIIDIFPLSCEFVSCIPPITGNVDNDSEEVVDIGDLTALIDYLFISFDEPACIDEANVDGDVGGSVDIGDMTALIDYLFISYESPAACP